MSAQISLSLEKLTEHPTPTIEELICAALRGERPFWPERGDDEFVARFLTRSGYHGVQALLYQSMQARQGPEFGWPKVVLDACRNTALVQTLWEIRHQALLKKVLARLSDIEVCPILFKGTALAYDVYSSPFLRARGDTDLLVPSHARYQVCEVLELLGFACKYGVKGNLVNHTAVYSRSDPNFGEHQLDLHWRISNAQALSKLFSYDELRSEARRLSALGPDAIAADHVHALLIACMHRATHKQSPIFVNGIEYYGGDRLIWLYDIHLLLGKLTPSQCDAFVEIAARKGLGRICLEAVEEAAICFHTVLADRLREALVRPGSPGIASRYLSKPVMYQYYANFMAVEGACNKLRFLAQLLFPPEKYMRQVYSQVKPNWLPWLYLRRAAIEIFKRLHRTIASEAVKSRVAGPLISKTGAARTTPTIQQSHTKKSPN